MKQLNKIVYFISIVIIILLTLFALIFINCAFQADIRLSALFITGAIIFLATALLLIFANMVNRSHSSKSKVPASSTNTDENT